MSLEILYTPRAKETLNLIYNFIHNEFGAKPAVKFALKAEKVVALIAEFPLMYKSTTIDPTVRIAFISKQCSLFYRVTDTEVHLLFFWVTDRNRCCPSS
jgi:plasmid stabilization system protein ParE